MQPAFHHMTRGVDPTISKPQARRVDEAVTDTFMRITGMGALEEAERDRVRDLLHLPIHKGGFGFLSQERMADAAYIAAWALVAPLVSQHVPALVCRQGDEGYDAGRPDGSSPSRQLRSPPSSLHTPDSPQDQPQLPAARPPRT
jgi:hypothetical protein